jgi:hypothetical protein
MALVRVWNDNVHPYEEVFKGDQIYIKPKNFIEMDENEAVQFKGTFKAPVLNVDGVHMPEGFKMIRIERISDQVESPKADDHQCLVCKYKGSSQKDLEEHLKAHKGQLVVDEEAEAEIKMRRKKAS